MLSAWSELLPSVASSPARSSPSSYAAPNCLKAPEVIPRRDLRVPTWTVQIRSPSRWIGWATWSPVSSGFQRIESRCDRLESVGHVAPFVAPATPAYALMRIRPSLRACIGRCRERRIDHWSPAVDRGQGRSPRQVHEAPLPQLYRVSIRDTAGKLLEGTPAPIGSGLAKHKVGRSPALVSTVQPWSVPRSQTKLLSSATERQPSSCAACLLMSPPGELGRRANRPPSSRGPYRRGQAATAKS
jgi:hypothetical protein